MKQIYFAIFALACLGSHAQVINFPDPNFKAAILSGAIFVDANGDGEITQQEAAEAEELYIVGPEVSNLEGLQYFTKLTNFYLWHTSVASFTLPTSTSPWGYNEISLDGNALLTSMVFLPTGALNRLSVTNNASLTGLALTGLTSVAAILDISGNAALATIDLPNLATFTGDTFTIDDNATLHAINFPSLLTCNAYDFSISHNANLASLDLSHKTFEELVVEHNGLTSVDLTQFTCNNNIFSIADNQLASVDLSTLSLANPSNLVMDLSGNAYTQIQLVGSWAQSGDGIVTMRPVLRINHTHLTSLSFNPQVKMQTLVIKDNLELESMNFHNGEFETCQGGYCAIGFFDISGNTALSWVCTDPDEVYALSQQYYVSGPDWVHQTIDPNVTVVTDCSLQTPQNVAEKLTLYPNPAKNSVNIVSENGLDVSAEIFNLSGRSLLKSNSSQNLSMDVSMLAAGTYLVKISSADGNQQTRKLIKY